MNSYEISDEVKTQLELESKALAVMSLLGLMRYAAKHGANRLVVEEVDQRDAKHAALVEAAQTALAIMDMHLPFTDAKQAILVGSCITQLRAALDAAKGEA